MEITDNYIIYVINDCELEDAYNNDNIKEFERVINDNPFIDYDVFEFETTDMVYAFLKGLNYGCDKVALCSNENKDKPYIDILSNI